MFLSGSTFFMLPFVKMKSKKFEIQEWQQRIDDINKNATKTVKLVLLNTKRYKN